HVQRGGHVLDHRGRGAAQHLSFVVGRDGDWRGLRGGLRLRRLPVGLLRWLRFLGACLPFARALIGACLLFAQALIGGRGLRFGRGLLLFGLLAVARRLGGVVGEELVPTRIDRRRVIPEFAVHLFDKPFVLPEW